MLFFGTVSRFQFDEEGIYVIARVCAIECSAVLLDGFTNIFVCASVCHLDIFDAKWIERNVRCETIICTIKHVRVKSCCFVWKYIEC